MIKLWRRWQAHREYIQRGKEFLRFPHDDNDPECVRWWGDRAGMDWKARCPSCNPAPVHYAPDGSVVHLMLEAGPDLRTTRVRSEVTCPHCLGVISQREPA